MFIDDCVRDFMLKDHYDHKQEMKDRGELTSYAVKLCSFHAKRIINYDFGVFQKDLYKSKSRSDYHG